MSATGTLLEPAPACDEVSGRVVVVDCSSGVDRPRWNLVEPSFYQTEMAGLEDCLTVAPLFHVKPDTTSFSLCLELRGAELTAQFPDTCFHSTHEGRQPVTFVWIDRRHVQVAWKDSAINGWGRWLYRFYVQDEAGKVQPIYFGFTCLAATSKPDLLNLLTPPLPMELPQVAGATVAATDLKLCIDLELSSAGDPVFRNLFRHPDALALPEGVYPEPLIVVKQSGKRLDMEFRTGGDMLFYGEVDGCDPGVAALGPPLALIWRGVTDPTKDCDVPDRIAARGFLASGCNLETSSATLCWEEPAKDEITRRASSFFFVSKGPKGEVEGTTLGTREEGCALVDPTVIHDQDNPPPGG